MADHGPGTARAGPRRRRRRLLFAAVAVLFVALFVELASALVWWASTGAFFSYSTAAALRAAAKAGAAGPAEGADQRDDREAAARRALEGGLALHPYLGFVYKHREQRPGDRREPVNRFGFIDFDDPIRRRGPDRFVVAITGGSVAAQVSLYAPEAFAEELGRSPRLRGRRVELVRMALGGFKQPQQSAALLYVLALGGEFDCVVNLDGFNEVALVGGNVQQGVPPYFPRGWGGLAEASLTQDKQLLIGRLLDLRDRRAAVAATAGAFGWSATAQLIWLLRDRSYGVRVADAAKEVEDYTPPERPYAVVGPGTSASLDAALDETALVWSQCSQSMHAVCAGRGIPYFHFLQPNQYAPDSKPIGDEERRVAVLERHPYREGVERGYPRLERRFADLRAAGVAFTDLRGIFRDHPEPLYVDTCCHLSRSGYELLARAMARAMRQRLDLDGAEVAGLRAEPPVLQIGDPTRPASFRVFGRLADGNEIDLTGVPPIEVRAEDSAVVEVGEGGQVRARRRGRTALHVRHGGHEVVVPVECWWPPVLLGKDGVASPQGHVPALSRTGSGDVVAGSTEELNVTACPTGLYGVLVVSPQPVPEALPLEPSALAGRVVVPLLVSGELATARVPLPARTLLHEHPLVFLRALFVDVAQGRVVAASNSLVLTCD